MTQEEQKAADAYAETEYPQGGSLLDNHTAMSRNICSRHFGAGIQYARANPQELPEDVTNRLNELAYEYPFSVLPRNLEETAAVLVGRRDLRHGFKAGYRRRIRLQPTPRSQRRSHHRGDG